METKKMPSSFDELIRTNPLPVLVDFWAEWCGPCKMVSPVIVDLSREWKGKVTVIKINVDEKPHIAGKYQITSIPTIALFKDGRLVHRIAGALPYPRMKAEFERFL